MLQTTLHVGDLIKINADLDPTNFEVHARAIDHRAIAGQIGLIINKNRKNTRYKVLLNTGAWAEITTHDLDCDNITVICSGQR